MRLASTDFFEPRDFYVIVRKDQKALLDEINYGIKHLEPSIKLEQQANKARREFLCNMSHDIRMPMNAIIGFTDIAKQQTQDADTMGCLEKISSRRFCRLCADACKRENSIVSNAKSVSKALL